MSMSRSGRHELPIFIEPGATIGGALNINDEVTAVDVDVSDNFALALSAGIVDLSGNAPTIVNNDEISALSKAISSSDGVRPTWLLLPRPGSSISMTEVPATRTMVKSTSRR